LHRDAPGRQVYANVLDASDAHQACFDGADAGGTVNTRYCKIRLPEPLAEIAAGQANLLSRRRAIELPVGIDGRCAATHLIAL